MQTQPSHQSESLQLYTECCKLKKEITISNCLSENGKFKCKTAIFVKNTLYLRYESLSHERTMNPYVLPKDLKIL